MVEAVPLKPYVQTLEAKLATGDATEDIHRSAMKALVESLGNMTVISKQTSKPVSGRV